MTDSLIQAKVLKIWTSRSTPSSNVLEQLSDKFPIDYVQFMLKTDGGSAQFPKIHFELWRSHEILKLNEQYKIQHYLGKNIIAIGTDGGPICFFFDFREDHIGTIGSLNLGDLDINEVQTLSRSFNELLQKMFFGEIDDDDL